MRPMRAREAMPLSVSKGRCSRRIMSPLRVRLRTASFMGEPFLTDRFLPETSRPTYSAPMIRLSALADRVRALRGRNRAFLALLSGALAALSMPPFDLWPALFIALPMLVWLSQADAGWRSSFLAGWLFGLGYFGVSFYWVGIAFLVDAATY